MTERFLSINIVMAMMCLTVSLSQTSKLSGQKLNVENGTIYYETMGKGPPVVFIHGGQMDRRMWDPQVELFSAAYTVIRYDVRGYGKSSLPVKPYSHVGDLYALMKQLKVEKAAIVGLSLGGLIGIDFTLTHPEMVSKLILAGPGLSGFRESDEIGVRFWKIVEAARDSGFSKAAELWMQDPYMIPAMENEACRKKIKKIVEDNAHCWLNNPMVERGVKPPAIERLSEIKAPTLLILGERDVPDIKSIVDTIAAKAPGAIKKVIPGAGHIVNMEKPDEFDRILAEFLNDLKKK